MVARVLHVVWLLASVGFLGLVGLTIHKAKARGKRLFRDEPARVLASLHQPAPTDHRWDIV